MIVLEMKKILEGVDDDCVVVLFDTEGNVDELRFHSTEYEFDGINAISKDYKYNRFIRDPEERQANRKKALVLSHYEIEKGQEFL